MLLRRRRCSRRPSDGRGGSRGAPRARRLARRAGRTRAVPRRASGPSRSGAVPTRPHPRRFSSLASAWGCAARATPSGRAGAVPSTTTGRVPCDWTWRPPCRTRPRAETPCACRRRRGSRRCRSSSLVVDGRGERTTGTGPRGTRAFPPTRRRYHALTRATRRAMRVSATRALCGGVGRGAPRN